MPYWKAVYPTRTYPDPSYATMPSFLLAGEDGYPNHLYSFYLPYPVVGLLEENPTR